MSKPKPDDTGLEVVRTARRAMLVPTIAYTPTDEQRELKARFWTAHKSNPVCDDNDVTPMYVEQVLKRSVMGWLKDGNFWQWFTTKDSTRLYLDIGVEKATELALFYLNPEVPMSDTARVALIRLVLEFGGRAPPKHKEVLWHDKEVGDLDEEQLDALIMKLSSKQKKKQELDPP